MPPPALPEPVVWLSAGTVQDGRSGVARYTIELVRALLPLQQGWRLGVVGLAKDRHHFSGLTDDQWLEIPARFAKGGPNWLWHQLFLPGLLRRRGGKLYHSPTYRRMLGAPGMPQVATIHDCAPFHLRGKYDFARRWFGTALTPALARRCGRILAVSEATANDVRKLMGVAPERLRVTYNGLNHQLFQRPTATQLADIRQRWQLPGPYFVYVARLEHPGKNHLRLIEAFEKVCAAHPEPLQLVLPGADWHGAAVIRERVAASPVAGQIRLAGFVADADLPGLYGGAVAMVMPSLIEGFGLPVAEALACGALVVSSDRGSLPEVGGAAPLYFDPEQVPAIAQALRSALTLPEAERQARRATGLAHVARYRWEEAARLTAQTYREMLSLPPTQEADRG